MHDATGPLEGIRVVELATWIQGPAAASMLGDLGADVVKIEIPSGGDAARGFVESGILQAVSTAPIEIERNFLFESSNQNKRSITLDLSRPRGKEIARRLVRDADVFLTSFPDSTIHKLGMEYATLASDNPRLIYARATGWGLKGPDAARGGFELAAIAKAGWMYLGGEPGMPPIRYAIGAIIDTPAAAYLALTIVAALMARASLGHGQEVDASLLGTAIANARIPLTFTAYSGVDYPRRGRIANIGNPLANYYECAEGKWILLSLVPSDKYWPSLCQLVGIEDLIGDSRFRDMNARRHNAAELIAVLDNVFATKPMAEWLEILAQDPTLIYMPIQTPRECINDAQVLANEYMVEYDHPTYGRTKAVGFPYGFSKTPASLRRPAPELGQHTEEILLAAGYSWSEIATLREQKVI